MAKEPVDTKIPNAAAWRIAYVSSDVVGRKTIATGLIVAPKGEPPAAGRPILAWVHGTTGTAQNCHPRRGSGPGGHCRSNPIQRDGGGRGEQVDGRHRQHLRRLVVQLPAFRDGKRAMPSAFPELKFTDLFAEDTAPMLAEIGSKKCIHAAGDTMTMAVGSDFTSILKAQPEKASARVKALITSSVDPVAPVAPVIIYSGTKDVTAPSFLGPLYQKQICGMGANVTRVQRPGEQNHYITPPTALPMFVPWFEDRFAEKSVANSCNP